MVSKHVEDNQLFATIKIYTDISQEPICLKQIHLQSTVADLLKQLSTIISFDYEQSILKLYSSDTYLHHEDILCDIESIYDHMHSLNQLEFVLVKKPIFDYQQKQDCISFQQFCLNQQEKYFHIVQKVKYVYLFLYS